MHRSRWRSRKLRSDVNKGWITWGKTGRLTILVANAVGGSTGAATRSISIGEAERGVEGVRSDLGNIDRGIATAVESALNCAMSEILSKM